MFEKGNPIALINENLGRETLAFTKTSTESTVLPGGSGWYHLERAQHA